MDIFDNISRVLFNGTENGTTEVIQSAGSRGIRLFSEQLSFLHDFL